MNRRSHSQPEENNLIGLLPVLGCENTHRRGDIIFVHGLAGHSWSTWHPQNQRDRGDVNFWLYWLGEDLQQNGIDVGIWTFGYEAARFQFSGPAMPRFDQASNLLEYLEVNDIGKRPLIFITHSMGGLLVKEVIRTAQTFNKQAIIEQTKWIVFLSTPHTGSHLANLIERIGVLARPTVNVRELKANEPELRNLNQWYRQNVENLAINTKVFYETQPIHGILVVGEDSANPGITDVRPVAVPFDHNSIAKPQRNDLVYLSVQQICCTTFTTTTPEDSQQKFLGFERSPELNYPPFLGRQEDIEKLKKQIIECKHKVISLWGQQGIGKSYLAKKLTEEQEIVAEFDYIIWTEIDKIQPLQGFLSDQIFNRLPVLNNVSQSDGISYFMNVLNQNRILLIIDGLEQLKEDDRNTYREYLGQLEVISQSDHRSCLLVTSQNKIRQFQIPNSFDYKLEGLDQPSLKQLIDYQGLDLNLSQLDKLNQTYNGNPGHLQIVCNHIEEICSGNVDEFLRKTTYNIVPYSELLDQQVKELSASERAICYWLAIYGTKISVDGLQESVRKLLLMVSEDNLSKSFIDALQKLHSSLIIERKDGKFFLIPEHRRYFINKIIQQAKDEILDLLQSRDLESYFANLSFDTISILKNYRLIADNYPTQDNKHSQEKRILGGLIKVLDAYSITQT
ncbi:MAG: NACHT domain-containing protein [Gloeotrichia echinulata GP01]